MAERAAHAIRILDRRNPFRCASRRRGTVLQVRSQQHHRRNPDITDTRENLSAIADIVGYSPVELLGYNSFAGAKYEGVGRVYTLENKKNREVDLTLFRNAKLSR